MSEWELVPAAIGRFKTRNEAIAGAMGDLDPGDELTVHQEGCASGTSNDCDCAPDVLIVPSPARA